MTRYHLAVLSLLLAASGCGERASEPRAIEPRPQPVIVYTGYEENSHLPSLFAEFTEKTGIRVTLKSAAPDLITRNIIENTGSPPADLILTPTVAGVWIAADEGALLPLNSELIEAVVPASFRDPDAYWTAVSFRSALIVFNENEALAGDVIHYEDLAKPEFKGKLCLSSSTLPENRSLIAMLIEKHGARGAELIVRAWVQNLALPPRKSEADLLRAIEAGTCAAGIVSSTIVGPPDHKNGRTGFVAVAPQPMHLNIETAGVNRHAREAVAARQLLDWFLSAEIQDQHARATGAYPIISAVAGRANPTAGSLTEYNAASVARYLNDAAKLVERAHYR